MQSKDFQNQSQNQRKQTGKFRAEIEKFLAEEDISMRHFKLDQFDHSGPISGNGEFPNLQSVTVTIYGEKLGPFADINSFKEFWINWKNRQK